MTRIAGTGGVERVFDGKRKDFIVMRKDSFDFNDTYEYVDDDGIDAEYDFTGCIGAMQIRKKKTSKEIVRTVSVRFSTTTYYLSVDADDMDMDAGKYYYDLQIYDANSKMVTKLYGDFVVLQDVTDMSEPSLASNAYNLDTAVTYQEGIASKNNYTLQSFVSYLMGETITNELELTSAVSYAFGLKNVETLVLSSNVLYQVMTIWEKNESTMSTYVSYLANLIGAYEYVMTTNNIYTIFVNG